MLPVRVHQMSQGICRPNLRAGRRFAAMGRRRQPHLDGRAGGSGPAHPRRRLLPGGPLRGRIAALKGKDPEAALREVAAAWTARTTARGKARQLWHYRRSLNSLATLPQPPERGK